MSAVHSQRFAPECEVVCDSEGDLACTSRWNECKKNPGHVNFIKVSDFTIDHLPPRWQSGEYVDFVHAACGVTVRLITKYTSTNRPNTYPGTKDPYPYSYIKGCDRVRRFGTGSMMQYHRTKCRLPETACARNGPCPCPPCSESEQPKMSYFEVLVQTATHVVYDDIEASNTVCECFYDTDNNRESVKCLYGVKTKSYFACHFGNHSHRLASDNQFIVCVTHDEDFVSTIRRTMAEYNRTLKTICKYDPRDTTGIIISHPHGLGKRISIGNFCHGTVSLSQQHTSKGLPLAVKCRVRQTHFSVWINELVSRVSTFNLRRPRPKATSFIQLGCKASEVALSLDDATSPIALDIDKVYLLPETVKFAVTSFNRRMADLHYEVSDGHWVRFNSPIAIYHEGRLLHFPPKVEFTWNGINTDKIYQVIGINWTYDIPTCPGSSGASVIDCNVCKYSNFRFNCLPQRSVNHSGSSLGVGRINVGSFIQTNLCSKQRRKLTRSRELLI